MARSGISIKTGGGGSLYRQIVDQVSERISSGVYPPGFRLPTSRNLAKELSVHRNTVVRAFEELASRGLVYTVIGSGTYVAESAESEPAQPDPAMSNSSIPWPSLFSSTTEAEPLTRYQRLMRAAERDAVNLAGLNPSDDLIPTDKFRACVDYVLRRRGAGALGYGPVEGLGQLREQLVKDLWRVGLPARADDIVITTGSQQGLDLIARALLEPGDTVLIEQHSYSGAINLFAALDARMVPVPVDSEGPLPEALHQYTSGNVKALYLMPNCSNPTGRCMSLRRRRELVEWSHRSGVPIVEDDYGADLDDATPPAPMRALDANVIYVGTFSKKLIPALRVGFLVCPQPVFVRVTALKRAMDLGTSVLMQYALAEYIERGYMRSHLRMVQAAYRKRREVLTEALREHLPTELTRNLPKSGVIFWIVLPDGVDAEDVFREALRQGVLVSPGTMHAATPHASSGLRLTCCAEPEEQLAEGARRLGKALKIVISANRGRTQTTVPSFSGA